MRLLPSLLLASACAATGSGPASDRGPGDLRELAGRIAGPEQDCVSTSTGVNLAPRGRQILVYRRGDTIWVNRLAAACPGLDEISQLVIETHGSQYCRGDHLRALEPGRTIAGPICILGSFTPYRRQP